MAKEGEIIKLLTVIKTIQGVPKRIVRFIQSYKTIHYLRKKYKPFGNLENGKSKNLFGFGWSYNALIKKKKSTASKMCVELVSKIWRAKIKI